MPGDHSKSFEGQSGDTPYVPSWMLPPLSAAQIAALKQLSEPGQYRVNWRPAITHAAYLDLKDRGLIEEAWTWASTTRPDVAITEAGVAARAG